MALVNLFDKTTAAGKVLLVHLQVLRQVVDFRRQNSDLDLWRTCIRFVRAELLDDLLLFLWVEHKKWSRSSEWRNPSRNPGVVSELLAKDSKRLVFRQFYKKKIP